MHLLVQGCPVKKKRSSCPMGTSVTVNKVAAPQFRGFFEDLVKVGAPVRNLGDTDIVVAILSQHPPGMAINWAQTLSRNVVDKDVQAWLNATRQSIRMENAAVSGSRTEQSRHWWHWSIDTLDRPAAYRQHTAASAGGVITVVAGWHSGATLAMRTWKSALRNDTRGNCRSTKPADVPTRQVATDAPATGRIKL